MSLLDKYNPYTSKNERRPAKEIKDNAIATEALIDQAIHHQERFIAAFAGSDNPQTLQLLTEIITRKDVLLAVQLSLMGYDNDLRLFT